MAPPATGVPTPVLRPAEPVNPVILAWGQPTYGEIRPGRKHGGILESIAVVAVVIVLAAIFAASNVFKGETPVYLKASGMRMGLVNKPGALDPSWEELRTFLVADETDRITYVINEWDCVDYAERLHNNAEVAGIKAAWVALIFRESASATPPTPSTPPTADWCTSTAPGESSEVGYQ